MIADKGYGSDEYRAALKTKGTAPCFPPRKARVMPAAFDKMLYRKHHKVENMFNKLKDSGRIHTRYDRCAHFHFSFVNRLNHMPLGQAASLEPSWR